MQPTLVRPQQCTWATGSPPLAHRQPRHRLTARRWRLFEAERELERQGSIGLDTRQALAAEPSEQTSCPCFLCV